jgi:hypothetical protein
MSKDQLKTKVVELVKELKQKERKFCQICKAGCVREPLHTKIVGY